MAEKILFLFASSVYLCPSLATLLNYRMCERGNGLTNCLKKLKIFQDLLDNIFFNSLICCEKSLWSFESSFFFFFCRKLTSKRKETDSNQLFFLGLHGWMTSLHY